MLKKVISSAFVLGVLVSIVSCNKIQTSTAALTYTGAISGHVILYDQYGSKATTAVTTTTIQINGVTTTSPDSTGYYIFGNISTGDYSIYATASGYAATATNSFQYLEDTLNKDIKLSEMPTFAPSADSVYPALSTPGDSVVLTINADTRTRNCILFLNSLGPAGNLPANYQLTYIKSVPANKTSISIVIPASDLSNIGIVSGTTIHCAAYGYVVGDVSVYEDQATGKNVYNAVSPAPVVFTTTAP